MVDPYQTLGVDRGCTQDELKEAFRTKALQAHPDRGGDAAEFVRLREAYQQIASEIMRNSPAQDSNQTDASRNRHDPNWEPELIVQDEPLPRVRPARPPDPNWQPDLVVGDEPLPRIRPPRPRASNWEPQLIVGAETSLAPLSASPANATPAAEPEPRRAARSAPRANGRPPQAREAQMRNGNRVGDLVGAHRAAETEEPTSNEALYNRIGVASIVLFALGSLVWMFWPSQTDHTAAGPSQLSGPSSEHGSSTEPGDLSLPEWPDISPKIRKAAPAESSGPGTKLQEFVVPEQAGAQTENEKQIPKF